MGLKPQTTREWVIVILGGVAAVTVLLYGFVISPGQELLARNETGIQWYRKQIDDDQGKVQRQQELRAGLLALRTRYSNYVSKINDIVIPRDIDDKLRLEFAVVDKQFGSDIRQTQFSPMKTNEIHKTLEFTLNNVLCNWRSLHAALQAIETAGHLVGFESMRVSSADEQRKTNVNVRAYIDVKSFIFPERGIQPWRGPDYAQVMHGLGRDIFGWPEGMIPATPVAPTPTLPAGTKPPWANTLKLTAIVKFPGRPHAVIRGLTDRKEYRYLIGSLVSNAMGVPVTVVSIDPTNETVTLSANDQTIELTLRDYRVSMFTPFEKRFTLFGENAALPTFDEAAVPSNAIESVTIPATYEKPLGGYAEAQMKTGLIVLPIDQYVQRRYRLEADHGLLVYNLQKLGVAEKGGLLKRDIITSVANKRVDSRELFTYVLNDAYKSEMASIPVTVLRGGQELTINLKFEKRK